MPDDPTLWISAGANALCSCGSERNDVVRRDGQCLSVASNYIILELTTLDGKLFLNVQRCAIPHEPRACPPSTLAMFTS